jgi:hypothetical protein
VELVGGERKGRGIAFKQLLGHYARVEPNLHMLRPGEGRLDSRRVPGSDSALIGRVGAARGKPCTDGTTVQGREVSTLPPAHLDRCGTSQRLGVGSRQSACPPLDLASSDFLSCSKSGARGRSGVERLKGDCWRGVCGELLLFTNVPPPRFFSLAQLLGQGQGASTPHWPL